jgi:hypothetical protein
VAAVLAAGPGAALSHASAAALWEIRPTAATKIHVSVPALGGRAKRSRIRVHRASTLKDDEVTDHHGISVTTPARTLLDLAASLPRRALERALDQAEILDLFDLTSLIALARTHAGERGAKALTRALMEHEAGTTVTRNELEELYRYHRTRKAFERDRERDAILAAAGLRTLRFTHRQLTRRPQSVLAALRSSA